MHADRRLSPYAVVYLTVFIALIWRPFLIGFYGDDFSHAAASTLEEALFYGRRERFFYFFPIAFPRYVFGHDNVGWGFYAITVAGLTAMSLYAFFKAVLDRLPGFESHARRAAMAGSIIYIFMPWSLTPVLWNTALSQLVMVALLALAGAVLFAGWRLWMKTVTFVMLFSIASLTYETVWGAWIPLILIKLALDRPGARWETTVIAGVGAAAQVALVVNYLPSLGMERAGLSGGSISLSDRFSLFVENVFVRYPFEVLSSMGVLGLLAAPFAAYAVYWLVKRKSDYASRALWYVLAACAAGILGGILVVSLGGYRVTATTDDARFLTVVSVWMAMVLAIIVGWVWGKGGKSVRFSVSLLCVLIVAGFFLRASSWVEGYFFQRDVLAAVPIEKIAELTARAEARKGIIGESTQNEALPLLVVNFDTPMRVFHGLDNTRGLHFVTAQIARRTGKEFVAYPLQARVRQSIFDGRRFLQYRCVSPDEITADIVAPVIIYWHVQTGEVRELDKPVRFGCTRTIRRMEVLGELLFPFSANPRRY